MPVACRALLPNVDLDASAAYGAGAFGSSSETKVIYTLCMLIDFMTMYSLGIGIVGYGGCQHLRWTQLCCLTNCIHDFEPPRLSSQHEQLLHTGDSNYSNPSHTKSLGEPLATIINLSTASNVRGFLACRRLLAAHQYRFSEVVSASQGPLVISMLVYFVATVVLSFGLVTGVPVAVQVSNL